MSRLMFVPLDDLGDNAEAIVARLLEAAEDTNVPKDNDQEEDDER